MKKSILNIVLIGVTLLVFYFIYKKTNWNETFDAVKNAHIGWLSFALSFIIMAHVVRAVRWNMLTKPQGYPLNLRRSFYAVMIGYIVNVGTSRGGEVARCAAAAKSEKAPLEFLLGTVITERIIDLMLMASLCLLCLATQFSYIWSYVSGFVKTKIEPVINIWLLISIVVISLLVFVWFLKRLTKKQQKDGLVQRLLKGVQSIYIVKNIPLFLFYSICIWFGYWMGVYGTLKALQVTHHLHFWASLTTLLFSAVGIAIPVPAGAGVWAAISVGLATVYGIPEKDANTFGIFNLAVSNLLMIVLGSICFLLWFIETKKKNE